MIEIEKLSSKYKVKRLNENNIEEIYNLCIGNPLYYQYCPPLVTRESIPDDFKELPPDKELKDKCYIGFYDNTTLLAIMDLIDGYPVDTTAFIGFFMMNKEYQGKGIGTAIINEVCNYLSLKFNEIRLAWVIGNKQSEHFWKKNGFMPIKETKSNTEMDVILAYKSLNRSDNHD